MSEALQRTLGDEFGLPPEVAAQAALVKRGRLTDERIMGAICELRAAGVPVREVCKALGVSAHTVAAAERSDPELLATLKERQAETWHLAATVCAESLLEAAMQGRLKPSEMGLSGAIAGTKAAELWSGGVAARPVEVRLTIEEAKRVQTELAARLAARVIDVQEVDK